MIRKILSKSYVSILVIIAFSFLLPSSPLHAYSNWSDIMAMFTMGHGVLKGVVPFIGAFEQRGPFIYFYYALTWIISPIQPLYGLFILENTSFVICFFIIRRMLLKFKNTSLFANTTSLIVILSFFIAGSINYGGSPEEILLPFYLCPLIWLVESIVNHKYAWTYAKWFMSGIFLAIVFWSKYIIIGYIAFPLFVSFVYELKQKEFLQVSKKVAVAFSGFGIGSLPVLLYYFVNNGLLQLFQGYFLTNLGYANSKSGFAMSIFSVIVAFASSLEHCIVIVIPAFFIGSYFKDMYVKTKFDKFALYFPMLMATLLVFVSKRPGASYAFPFLAVSLVFMAAGLPIFLNRWKKFKSIRLFFISLSIFSAFLLPMSTIMILKQSSWANYYALVLDKDELYNSSRNLRKDPEYLIGKEIKKDPGSLIVFGSLDQGYFYWANRIPQFYSWEETAPEYSLNPKSIDQQYNYLKNANPKYVILYVAKSKIVKKENLKRLKDSREYKYPAEYQVQINKKYGTIGIVPKVLNKNYFLVKRYKQKIIYEGYHILEYHYLFKRR